jgi:hypothetical protein
MSRTLVMTVLLAAWLATGIVAGIVMSYRRHDRFPWWLLEPFRRLSPSTTRGKQPRR